MRTTQAEALLQVTRRGRLRRPAPPEALSTQGLAKDRMPAPTRLTFLMIELRRSVGPFDAGAVPGQDLGCTSA